MRAMTTTFAILALAGLLVGCGGGSDGGTNPPTPTVAELTAQGWTAFEAHDYAGAQAKFEAAIAEDGGYAEAHLGRGWAQLERATSAASMQAAAATFSTALGYGADVAATRAGRAAASLGAGGAAYVQAVADAQVARAANPAFAFGHRTSFNVTDLRLIEAFAQAGQGDFALALAAADAVADSGIVAGDPDTWQVGNETHATFTSAVMAFLESLSTSHAG